MRKTKGQTPSVTPTESNRSLSEQFEDLISQHFGEGVSVQRLQLDLQTNEGDIYIDLSPRSDI